MNIINLSVPAGVSSPVAECGAVVIGYVGEGGVTQVVLDFSAWAEAYGDGVITLGVQRSGDPSWFPVALVVDGTSAAWLVSKLDTNVEGMGVARFAYTIGGAEKRSAVWQFFVDAGLQSPEGAAPDPYEDWVEDLTELGAVTLQHAQDARAAAEAAEDAAENAGTAAEAAGDARAAAEAAQEAAETAEGSAGESARDAAQSADTARDAAQNAGNAAQEAGNSAAAAAGSTSTAERAATAAAGSAELAGQNAEKAETAAGASGESARDAAQSAATAQDAAQAAGNAAQAAGSAVEQAAGSASTAESAATAAAGSAELAGQSAEKAETAVSHYPKIVSGYWQVWDPNTEQYVTTGIKAEGEKGDPGEVTAAQLNAALAPYRTAAAQDVIDAAQDAKLEVLRPAASAQDVGKALIVKTVADGKATAYEFGEAGGGGGDDKAGGVYYFDLMPTATVASATKSFSLEKNKISASVIKSGGGWETVNMLGEPTVVSGIASGLDLSSATFYDLKFDAYSYDLIMQVAWSKLSTASSARNGVYAATKAQDGTVTIKLLINDAKTAKPMQRINVSEAIPEIRENNNIAFYFSNYGFHNPLAYRFVLEPHSDESTKTPHSAALLKRVGCIGDSYTAGFFKISGETNKDYPEYSWPHFISKMTGNVWENFGASGSTSKTWVTEEAGYSHLAEIRAAGNKCQAYVIGLGLNDATHSTRAVAIGTAEDIETDADSFYAYYYKLVAAVHAVNTQAPIFCNTAPAAGIGAGSKVPPYNTAIRTIAEHCSDKGWPVYLCDLASQKYDNDKYYKNPILASDYVGGHYTGLGYEFFAECYYSILSELMANNAADFQKVHLIPFDEIVEPDSVTVSGTAPTITAEANTRYVCGEVTTLSFTPPASGVCDVIFTSGTTATVLTVPSTVKWANDFDPTSLDANTTYELNICDGLGVAASWT